MELKTSRIESASGALKRSNVTRGLSLYKQPPEEDITVDEFELLALDRLQLLRSIESLKTRGVDGEEFNSKMAQLEKKYLPFTGKPVELRKDHISHFILRLAYCRTEDLRRWFITQESHLLKFRLDKLSDQERAEFMTANNLRFEPLSHDDKLLRKEFLVGLAGIDEHKFSSTVYYK